MQYTEEEEERNARERSWIFIHAKSHEFAL
jgi:hypothetical protein